MKLVFFFFLVFNFLFFTLNVYACRCATLPAIYESYKSADAVFIGKVVSSNEPKDEDESYDGHDILFDFEVIESFKGITGNKVKLNRGTKSSSCYSGYTIGETYLVYASDEGWSFVTKNSQKSEGTIYQGSFCDRTSNLSSAQDQIFFI